MIFLIDFLSYKSSTLIYSLFTEVLCEISLVIRSLVTINKKTMDTTNKKTEPNKRAKRRRIRIRRRRTKKRKKKKKKTEPNKMQICYAYQIKLLYTFSHSLRHFFKHLTLTYVPPLIQTPNIPFHASIEQKNI
jgi:hypothetical protein